jgi:hypothetical protein
MAPMFLTGALLVTAILLGCFGAGRHMKEKTFSIFSLTHVIFYGRTNIIFSSKDMRDILFLVHIVWARARL